MNYLLDTHTLIWFLEDSPSLSKEAGRIIENTSFTKWISVATLWEMGIKVSLGKLTLKYPFPLIVATLSTTPLKILPIRSAHTILVSQLPFHHRDPFDRILIAQGLSEGMTVISKDGHFSQYGVSLVW